MKNLLNKTLIVIAFFALQACSNDDATPISEPKKVNTINKKGVIENYAKIVYQNYKDSYDAALNLQVKIKDFVSNPTDVTLNSAKKAWLEAREPYGQSEVFRGSNGPIDTEGSINNEGQLNAWPLNEAYIDYVADKNSFTGTYDVSIISSTEVITKDFLAGKNEAGNDEKAVATGWHAIEFLLWGQDNTAPAEKKAGQRPFSDYTTAENSDRRKTYLTEVTQLLVDDLKALVDTWAKGGAYYKEFMSLDENKALNNMLNGPYFLAAEEASNERMLVPATGTDGIAGGEGQEDEHSCFSDNTHRDIFTNAQGVFNVLRGTYGNIKGVSFIDLLKQKDAVQAEKLQKSIEIAEKAIKAIDDKAKSGTPFDLIIMQEDLSNPGIVLAGDKALKGLADVIKESAAKLGIITVAP